MRKNDIIEGKIEEVKFPNIGIIKYEDKDIKVKHAIKGQVVKVRITKKRRNKIEGKIVEIVEKSPIEEKPKCVFSGKCGGCSYQTIPYDTQLIIKKEQVKALIDTLNIADYEFMDIVPSPLVEGYRNKMEYSFGDECKGGDLALGMHKRGAFHDIVTVNGCIIVDEDFNKILVNTLEYFKERNIPYYRKYNHEGVLRHLVVRRATNTGQIMINLVTSSQQQLELEEYVQMLTNLNLSGEIKGILHTINDGLADVVKSDRTDIIYGQEYFEEKLLNLKFKISAFSFFQTNSKGAEELYSVVRDFAVLNTKENDTKDKMIFDLYCGTGTIAQIMSPVAKKVIGIEIVEEAVEAAKENAKLNGLTNCKFIAGDVLKEVDNLNDKPDLIILDPPRDGIHPKAINKIINFGAKELVYVSCKPTSLVRDLEVFIERGYKVEKIRCVDMFPFTPHVETVVKLQRRNP